MMGTGIDDLLNGIGSGPATTTFNTPVNNALLDIFGGPQQTGTTPTSNAVVSQDLFSMGSTPQSQNFVPLYEDSNLNIEIVMIRNAMNSQESTLKAHFSNKSGQNLSGLSLQVAVQKYMKLTLLQISSTALPIGSTRKVT